MGKMGRLHNVSILVVVPFCNFAKYYLWEKLDEVYKGCPLFFATACESIIISVKFSI